MKIWQYAVILLPSEKEQEAGKTSVWVVPVSSVRANDQNGAIVRAAQSVPQEFMDRADRLEVAVRPF